MEPLFSQDLQIVLKTKKTPVDSNLQFPSILSLSICFRILNTSDCNKKNKQKTLNSLLDIKYEPHICKNSPGKWLIFLETVYKFYLWKVHEDNSSSFSKDVIIQSSSKYFQLRCRVQCSSSSTVQYRTVRVIGL